MSRDRPVTAETPIRAIDHRVVDGCRVLGDRQVDYLDGSEDALAAIVARASDLSSLSDELESHGTDWPRLYHLARARSNIARSLDLNDRMKVLEIGAGLGAVTRYLGETCAAVDAVEPVLERARVARARTRDQANVEVFVGDIDDVPNESAYDAVMVIGVLEYVAGGSDDPAAYVSFLRRCRDLVREGGSVVVAIENALGVKYLAGAAEDHSGRSFDSLERYPSGTPARCFSRRQLTRLLEAADLDPVFLHAFPDYKLTRAVLADDLFDSQPQLATRIPQFPSPDWDRPRARGVDERSLWRSLVDSGLGRDFANSFLVVASRGAAAPSLWPAGRLAVFFSQWRLSRYLTRTEVVRDGGRLVFSRSRLAATAGEPAGSSTVFDAGDSALVEGDDMLDVLAVSDDDGFRRLLADWAALVGALPEDAPMPVDLIPQNIVVTAERLLVPIDQEWARTDYSRDDVLRRGALLTGIALARQTPASRWAHFETVRDVVALVGSVVGLDREGEWIDGARLREAAFQADVSTPRVAHPNRWSDEIARWTEQTLSTRLVDLPLGVRDHERTHADEGQRRRADEAEEFYRSSLRQVYSSASWRVTRPLRAAGAVARRARGLRRNS